MTHYLVVLEQGKDGGWGAYAPDLPGLGVAADTEAETMVLIRKGVALHLAGLLDAGETLPPPSAYATYCATSEADIAQYREPSA